MIEIPVTPEENKIARASEDDEGALRIKHPQAAYALDTRRWLKDAVYYFAALGVAS